MKIIFYDDGSVLEMANGITICYSDKEIVEVAVEDDKEKYKKKIEFDLEEQSEQTFHKSKKFKSHNKQQVNPQEKVIKEVELYTSITASELANKMSEKVSDVIKALINFGMIADANKTLDLDTAELVVEALGHKFRRVEAVS